MAEQEAELPGSPTVDEKRKRASPAAVIVLGLPGRLSAASCRWKPVDAVMVLLVVHAGGKLLVGAVGFFFAAAVVQRNLIQLLTTFGGVFARDARLAQIVGRFIDCARDRFNGEISQRVGTQVISKFLLS